MWLNGATEHQRAFYVSYGYSQVTISMAVTHDGPLRIFVGFDPRQPISYTVLQHSLVWRAKKTFALTPLLIENLPIQRQGLTPFTYSRFLVPWLCNFEGWALFLDPDMIFLDDVGNLFDLADDRHAAMVTKSQYRFEWASLILFNCGHPANKVLTPDFIDSEERCSTPHLMDWLKGEEIGDLPAEWNHLVGYDQPRGDARLVHYTQGIPAFPEVLGCEYSDHWHEDHKTANRSKPWSEIMGTSVHALRLSDGRVLPRLHPDAAKAVKVAAEAANAPGKPAST